MGLFSTYESLAPMIIAEVPGIHNNILLQELKKAGHYFCRDTRIWREKLDPIDVVALQDTYNIDKPGSAELFEVYAVRMRSDSTESFDNIMPFDATYYTIDKANSTLRFYDGSVPQSSVTSGMEIEAVFVPNVLAVSLPSWIINNYAYGIIAKAKMELFKQKGKNWYNTELAGYYKNEYNDHVSEAKSDSYKEFKNMNTVIQYREFI